MCDIADLYEWYSSHRRCCQPVLLHEGQVSGMQATAQCSNVSVGLVVDSQSIAGTCTSVGSPALIIPSLFAVSMGVVETE